MKKTNYPKLIFIVFLLLSQLLLACAPNITESQSKGEIDQLIKALDYKFSVEVRAKAIEALVEIGEPAVENLLYAYHDRNPKKRENIELALREISNKAIDGFVDEAKEVCAGTAMEGAGEFNSVSDDPTPLIYVNEGDSVFDPVTQNLNRLPVDWLPYERADLQIVVCLQSDKQLLDGCSYQDGSSIKRYKRLLKITLHEAATGLKIGDFFLMGEQPQPCPYSVTKGSRPDTNEFIGEIPTIYASMIENLRTLGFDIKD